MDKLTLDIGCVTFTASTYTRLKGNKRKYKEHFEGVLGVGSVVIQTGSNFKKGKKMKSCVIDIGTIGFLLGCLDGVLVDGVSIGPEVAKEIKEKILEDIGAPLASNISGNPEEQKP